MTPLTDFPKLCVHTITTKPWSIEEAIKNYSAAGVKGITVWRDVLEGRSIKATGQSIRDAGLDIVSYCRGGFFPSVDAAKRETAIEDNRRCIEEAAELGAPMIVLVCGADPGQSLEDSRKQIEDGIAAVLPQAEAAGVKLAIEPLHPMYADTRSAVSSLAQANEMAEKFGDHVGIALDVYHVWWEENLKEKILRCGANGNLLAFHICDWKVPTNDFLWDRGLMGEGCINIPQIRTWVEEAGFTGYNEVEIFSNIYWDMDQHVFLEKIKDAYLKS